MPIYEYACSECAHEFETLVLSGSREDPSCPECGSDKLTRLVSTFGMLGGSARGSKSACAACSSTRCGSCRA